MLAQVCSLALVHSCVLRQPACTESCRVLPAEETQLPGPGKEPRGRQGSLHLLPCMHRGSSAIISISSEAPPCLLAIASQRTLEEMNLSSVSVKQATNFAAQQSTAANLLLLQYSEK